jgi:tyrosine-protein kinase Etk/Wzc
MTQPDSNVGPSTAPTLRDLGDAVRRNWGILLVVTLAVIGLTALATAFVRPTYESQTTLQIIEKDPSNPLLEDLGPIGSFGIPGLGDSELDTDIGVLRSRRIVDAVVDSLALHVQLRSPDARRGEILRVVDASQDAVPGSYTFRRGADGTYTLDAARVRQPDGEYTRSLGRARAIVNPPDRIQPGVPFRMGAMELAIEPTAAGNAPEKIVFRVRPFHDFVRRLREKDLRVRQLDDGQLLLVDYRNNDPELAAATVNFLARQFIDYKLSTSTTDSRSRVSVLRDQVAQYEQEIRAADERLQAFQEAQLLVAPEEQATQQIRRIAEIQVTRDAAEIERDALASLLAEIERSEPNPTGESPYRRLATFPSFIQNGAIQDLLQALIVQEDALAEQFLRGPDHPDVRAARERIAELELQLLRLGRNYLNSLESQIASAGEGLARFATELRAMPSREIEFARLTRDRMLLNDVYLTLQQRLKEAEVLEAIEIATGSVRVLDRGIVADRPIFPNPAVNLVLGGVLGLLLGLMVVVARESSSTRIRSPADARLVGGDLPLLGSIPRIREPALANGNRGKPWDRVAGVVLSRAALPPASVPLVTREVPASHASDAFRALRTNIAFSGSDDRPRLIVVTSALRGEGKTISASNLAVTLAQQGSRTLLVDADLRTSTLHRLFGVERHPGLVEVLAGTADMAAAVRSFDVGPGAPPLHFLPSGVVPTNPTDLLGSEAAARLFEHLRELFDYVVVDAPALDLGADAALLGRLADATILVVRAGSTEQEALRDAVTQLQRLRAPIGGVVLNDA